ncbi:hypothetical protein [uncultured Campylobacter sp.]|uniref:hypothetical protein n=1 Tax=uncultured Campylobacter sp. TaxID=218934 RepID=UPI0026134047|nr:hypothetical protein [uncultured Campylobacter sp.]
MQEPQDSAQSEIAGKSGEEIIAYIKEKYDKFADETQNSVEALEIKFVLATAGIGIDDPKETVERLQDCVSYIKENIFPCTYLLRQRAIEYTRAQNTFIKSMNKFIKNISLIRLEAFVFGTIFGVFLMFLLHL